MTNLTKYCIIIPAYNAETTLPQLINKINEIVQSIQIIVINDGSYDSTGKIANVLVVNHNRNQGKGEAIKTGFRTASDKGYTYAIFLDADLQHDPTKIPDFIKTQCETNADLVVGKRDFNLKNMPFFRYLSNTWTSGLITIRTGRKISDSQCGFRLVKLDSVNINDFVYTGFQFESEFVIKYLLNDKIVAEVEIPTIYASEKSSINHIPDTLKFIKLYFNSFLWKKRGKK